jgi:hypothetical protein
MRPLLFTHAEWREPDEFIHHCSTKWAYFLLGLKAWLEGVGAGNSVTSLTCEFGWCPRPDWVLVQAGSRCAT